MRYKWLVLVAVVAGYFFIIRPARGIIVKNVIYPPVYKMAESQQLTTNQQSSVSILISWPDGSYINYKISFGIFFLLPAAALVFSAKRYMLARYLILIHISGIMLALIFLFAGLSINTSLLNVSPVISKYLVPAFSLSLVPLALSDKFLNKKS